MILNNKYILVLGLPGAGKGTICSMLSNDYGFIHISIGEILREEVKDITIMNESKQLILNSFKEGSILPFKFILNLLKTNIEKYTNSKNSLTFLLDGCPTDVERYLEFEKTFGEFEICIYLDCDEKTIENRLITRNRFDDNIVLIKKRINIFKENAYKIINYCIC